MADGVKHSVMQRVTYNVKHAEMLLETNNVKLLVVIHLKLIDVQLE